MSLQISLQVNDIKNKRKEGIKKVQEFFEKENNTSNYLCVVNELMSRNTINKYFLQVCVANRCRPN